MIDDMIPRAEADALVAAAFEATASKAGQLSMKVTVFWPPVERYRTPEEYRDIIRALTPEDASAALEAMLAEAEKRGEKRGILRAAEIAQRRARIVEHQDNELGATHRAHVLVDPRRIAAAIRAEVKE